MCLDFFASLSKVGKWLSVRRERNLHLRTKCANFVELFEETIEMVGLRRHSRDMWGDGWQHVIAAQHDARFWVEETQVILSVSGRVNSHPLAPG